MTRLLAVFVVAILPSPASTAPVPADAARREESRKELARLVGTWKAVSYRIGGGDFLLGRTMVIEFKADGSLAWNGNDVTGKVAVIDPAKKPKEIDYALTDADGKVSTGADGKPRVQKAIYKLDGDTFIDCFSVAGKNERPTEFESTVENGWAVVVYERVKKKN